MGIVTESLTCYLVEWYCPEVDEIHLPEIVAEIDRSLISVRAQGASVRYLYILAVPADEVVFGVFEAGSADVVALVCRRAGIPALRLTAAVADGAHNS
jgi:hypothetical protein